MDLVGRPANCVLSEELKSVIKDSWDKNVEEEEKKQKKHQEKKKAIGLGWWQEEAEEEVEE